MDTLLLFDLDGTLWDSAPAVADAWNEIFRRECPGLKPLTVDDIHGVMGMTMKEISLAQMSISPAGTRSLTSAAATRWNTSTPTAAPSTRISVPSWNP